MADELVYHYTSVEALFQIVKSKRFRLGNIFFMNDYMEVEWCFNLALEMMKHRKEKRIDALFDLVQRRGFEYVFCGCFSALSDDLSQWRGYADDGRGVAIGVDVSRITEVNKSSSCHTVKPMKVVYEKEKQKADLDTLLKKFLAPVKDKNKVTEALRLLQTYSRLSSLAVQFKNPAFSREEETRLVLRSTLEKHNNRWHYEETFVAKFPHGIDFLNRGGTLVPYADIEIPLEALGGICLGPRFGDKMAKVALQLFLSKEGIVDGVVQNMSRSEASYRQPY